MSSTFLHFNVLKTLYFNFKFLPFRDAIRFPVFLFGKIDLCGKHGKIIIKGPVKKGIIRIGSNRSELYGKRCGLVTRIRIDGTVTIENKGGRVEINNGVKVIVKKGGHLHLGGACRINSESMLVCRKGISIGDTVRISWQCQIFDTNFHHIRVDGVVTEMDKKVEIGSRVWIGNRVTINAGSVIPDGSVIASNSLVNKDFSQYGPKCLYGGIPAKMIRPSVERIFE